MARKIRLAAAQMGATHRQSPREEPLRRMIKLLDDAACTGAEVVLFPETAFTTFFPRYLIEDEAELASFFEYGDITTSSQTAPLFERARFHGIDISVGFAEACDNGDRFNTSIYYHAKSRSILAKYRKIHLPGDFEPFSDPNATNQLEKRYFKPGNLGFEAFRAPDQADDAQPIFGMMICNDRRWPEAWRCLGLQGVEVVLCGYNTAGFAPHLWGGDTKQDPEAAKQNALLHHKLLMQSNSYMNATFSVCAARCGLDDGKYNLICGSCIIDPEGKILAEARTKEDEIVVADCDLDKCRQGKSRTFDFARHRRVEHYSRIVEQTGVVEPLRLVERQHATPVVAIPTNRDGVSEIHDTSQEQHTESVPTASSTSPASPSAKPIRILLINPNATKSMTDACVTSVQSTLPSDIEVHGFTGPADDASTAIESQTDNVLSSAASFRALHPILSSPTNPYHALLVACYSDHALIKMLREEFELPVIGIMEASLFYARTLGSKFGIVATGQRSKIGHEGNVRTYGMEKFCAIVESCDLGVLDLERLPRETVIERMRGVSERLVERGAEVLCLGCAGMTGMKEAVGEVVRGEGVEVVDGVVAGVQHLVGVVRMGGRTSKVGLWRSSAAGRERRGQGYV
ncbi:N-carbamoyl-D-amino acid hydrolase [Fulvia fulva]|uniref:N-carbamoyl-D-amino acid hydrolase n=1 Tax=Passalora fulva TaxID=5499 RepID=A0A9Q8UWI7_PASFU|nr:N-carbamoyl-D-amino acid hydrolase [Fulvia fulva]KAK4609878.1 N-carbamoyl-D-amino acid hydrolase [Fulvia fulva]UJO25030.1 N-carbamoyl-D-amino acid hydrolase [Fulvia fulva]WPV22637.1 N-carbamoyl-D-amino acid hydrolase [Fulvia fulva]